MGSQSPIMGLMIIITIDWSFSANKETIREQISSIKYSLRVSIGHTYTSNVSSPIIV